jgi:hypothetical protein
MGFGLVTSQNLATLVHGSISVKSMQNGDKRNSRRENGHFRKIPFPYSQGSIFTLSVPLFLAPDAHPLPLDDSSSPRSPSSTPVSLSQMRSSPLSTSPLNNSILPTSRLRSLSAESLFLPRYDTSGPSSTETSHAPPHRLSLSLPNPLSPPSPMTDMAAKFQSARILVVEDNAVIYLFFCFLLFLDLFPYLFIDEHESIKENAGKNGICPRVCLRWRAGNQQVHGESRLWPNFDGFTHARYGWPYCMHTPPLSSLIHFLSSLTHSLLPLQSQATRVILDIAAGLDKQTKIVAITSSVSIEVRKDCFQNGMSGFIAKPVSLDALIKVLNSFT